MAQPTIQIDYGILEEAVRALLDKVDTVESHSIEIDRSFCFLQDGGWQGEGASAFFDEMTTTVFPALNRLRDALNQTATSLHEISVTMQQAEEDALACFVGDITPPAPPEASAPAAQEEDDGGGILWTLGELAVSVLWEPADWFFTARDVINGDYYALVGLIPFVPSRAGKLLKEGVEHADDIVDVVRHGDDIVDAVRHGDDVADAVRHGDDVADAVRHGDDVADAARQTGRARDAAGRMQKIHNADYKRARQEYLESLASDPSKPAHVRGWVQQELNRLNKPPRASDWLSRTSDTEAEILAKRQQRAQYRGSRGSSKLDYESPDIRQPQGYDVGHRNNQLPMDQVNRPENFQLENSGMNRSKGARHKR